MPKRHGTRNCGWEGRNCVKCMLQLSPVERLRSLVPPLLPSVKHPENFESSLDTSASHMTFWSRHKRHFGFVDTANGISPEVCACMCCVYSLQHHEDVISSTAAQLSNLSRALVLIGLLGESSRQANVNEQRSAKETGRIEHFLFGGLGGRGYTRNCTDCSADDKRTLMLCRNKNCTDSSLRYQYKNRSSAATLTRTRLWIGTSHSSAYFALGI